MAYVHGDRAQAGALAEQLAALANGLGKAETNVVAIARPPQQRKTRESDLILDWHYTRPRVTLRGNHALSVANSASGNEGQCFASGRPDQWAVGSARWIYRRAAPCSSRHDRILGPAASKKAWDQRCAIG